MRFLSIVLSALCLPALIAALALSPVIAPAMLLLSAVVPGFAAFKRTSGKRSWNLASFHSPHSLTWRWLVSASIGTVFSKPRLYMTPRRDPYFGDNPFVSFAFNIGIAGAAAQTNNCGWQFSAFLLGVHVRFSQQKPMWYRDLYHRARDEADQLAGRAWFSDKHPNKVHVPPRPNAPASAALQ